MSTCYILVTSEPLWTEALTTIKHALTGLAIASIALLPAACSATDGATPNLLANPDFENGTEGWRALVGDDPHARYTVAPGAGRDGSACVVYRKTAAGYANSHFDQDFDVEPDTLYAFGAWIRGDGRASRRPRERSSTR